MHLPSLNKSPQQGFTLIELLVVAPVAIIAIATMISLMVGLVGDVVVSKERSTATFSNQEALDRIEQDARIATTYMQSYDLVTSPQGRNGSNGAFNVSNGDLILTQYATTGSPYDATRNIVYYADQPNPCVGAYTLNRPLTVRIIYFTTDDGVGTKTLWRRTLVPTWSTSATDTTKTCAEPWQRDSCPADTFVLSTTCRTRDEKMAEYVSAFTTVYYTESGAVTTNPTLATSLKVTLATSKQVAGQTLANTGTTRAYHTNTTTDTIPTAPNVYVYNEAINVYNNPVLTTFAWDAVPNAGVYGVRYRINAGGWVNMPDQVGNQFQLNSARPLNQITLEVTAKNDMGSSAATTFIHTKPLWTVANLENNWECYSPSETTYPCPSYTLTTAGLVILRGLADAGVANDKLFTMPEGLRPRQQQIFPGSGDDKLAKIEAEMDGDIVFEDGTADVFLSLDNVRYIADGTPGITWNNATITTANGWANYGAPYGTPSYALDGAGRVVMVGLLDGNASPLTAGANMLAFANGFQPPGHGIYPGISSTFAFYPNQVTSTMQVQMRGMGSTNAWNSIGAIYYPTGTSVAHTALTLQNSWANYPTDYNNAAYAKGPDNVVSLRGLIRFGTTTRYTTIGTLPAGYRPGKSYAIITSGYRTTPSATQIPARFDINVDGTIKIMNLSTDNLANGYLSLEGIHFYQEN